MASPTPERTEGSASVTGCQLAHNASQQAQLLHKNDIIFQHHLAHSALPQQGHTRDREEKAVI